MICVILKVYLYMFQYSDRFLFFWRKYLQISIKNVLILHEFISTFSRQTNIVVTSRMYKLARLGNIRFFCLSLHLTVLLLLLRCLSSSLPALVLKIRPHSSSSALPRHVICQNFYNSRFYKI